MIVKIREMPKCGCKSFEKWQFAGHRWYYNPNDKVIPHAQPSHDEGDGIDHF